MVSLHCISSLLLLLHLNHCILNCFPDYCTRWHTWWFSSGYFPLDELLTLWGILEEWSPRLSSTGPDVWPPALCTFLRIDFLQINFLRIDFLRINVTLLGWQSTQAPLSSSNTQWTIPNTQYINSNTNTSSHIHNSITESVWTMLKKNQTIWSGRSSLNT